MNENLLILYSGGADSVLLLKLAQELKKKPLCILIDYEQKHIKELLYAKKYLVNQGISSDTIKISGLNINSGLTGNCIEGQYTGVSIYNVPARNTFFLSLAASVAESNGIDEIWLGCDMSDYYGEFPDCKQEYIGNINKIFKIAFSKPITVEAPLLGMKKEMVLALLKNSFTITPDMLYSGYEEYKGKNDETM